MMMYQTIRFVIPLCMAVSILSGCSKAEEATAPSSPKPVAVSPSPKAATTPIAAVSSSSPSSATSLKPQAEKMPKPAEVKCPPTEIKGKMGQKGKVYHIPGSNNYDAVKAEACFKDVTSAEKAGYRAPK